MQLRRTERPPHSPGAAAGHRQEGRQPDAQKANDEWKQKIADQQGKIDLLSRELDVTQREYRLRAAAFYADAGNRLRGSGFMGQGRRPIQKADRPKAEGLG